MSGQGMARFTLMDHEENEEIFMATQPAKLPSLHFATHEPVEFHEWLATLDPHYKPHVLSSGAGVDSNALLVKYCHMTDAERGFPLCNLVVIHAVVGGESRETQRIMEDAIFPL